jgi:hypothetical protein
LRRLPVAVAGAAIVASFVFLVANGTHFGFVFDDWELLIRRPGWSAPSLFHPFHEHLIVAPVLLYKVLQATFGMTSAVPYYVAAMLVFSLAAALIFAFLRARVGEWLAFAAILPILFLGASSEDLLWAFQVGFFGSVAAGVGMLLALDRGDRRGDRIAACLAVVALAFGSIGIPFAIAAVVDVLVGPRPRRSRAFVALIPIAAYAIWWLGWGHQAEHQVSLHNILHLPSYVFDSVGAGFAALFGQQVNSNSDPGHPPVLFRIVAVLAAIGVATRVVRERRVSRGLAVTLTIAFAFWMLAGLDRDFNRPPISSRYQYPSAVFIVLIAGEALRGVRLPRFAAVAVVAVAVVAMLGGISLLNRERSFWNGSAASTRSVLAAVELAGPAARPGFLIRREDIDATVARYRDAVGRFGSPAYDEGELLERADAYGSLADETTVEAIGLRLVPIPRQREGLAGCRLLRTGSAEAGVPVPAGSFLLANRSSRSAEVLLGRFAADPGARIGRIRPGGAARLRLPAGASPRPWLLGVVAGRVAVCPLGD